MFAKSVTAGVLLALVTASGVQAENVGRASDAARLERPDGSEIIWYVDRQGGQGKQGLFVIAQGSGCGSVQNNENVARGKAMLKDFAVVTVEDYGVNTGDPERMNTDKCPATFYAHHTISQRASDYRQVVGYLEHLPWWDGKLALFGGSEGGAVVQMLAPKMNANAVVVFSSATGLKFRDAFIQVLPPPVAASVPAGLVEVRKNPTASTLFLGNSYRWWADIMDRRLSDDLIAAAEPILVVQGERDQSNPVASARAVRDAFQSSKKCNLTYWEFPGLDHHMEDAEGHPHIDEVLDRISGWLHVQLYGAPALSF